MWRTAAGGGVPGRYATPGPLRSGSPSPKFQRTALTEAVTVTRSRPAEADNDCGDGDGESQNHEAAPVSPAVCRDGLASIAPAGSASRVATVVASTAGLTAG